MGLGVRIRIKLLLYSLTYFVTSANIFNLSYCVLLCKIVIILLSL